eukprot:707873-Rhodomonas_salina.3
MTWSVRLGPGGARLRSRVRLRAPAPPPAARPPAPLPSSRSSSLAVHPRRTPPFSLAPDPT